MLGVPFIAQSLIDAGKITLIRGKTRLAVCTVGAVGDLFIMQALDQDAHRDIQSHADPSFLSASPELVLSCLQLTTMPLAEASETADAQRHELTTAPGRRVHPHTAETDIYDAVRKSRGEERAYVALVSAILHNVIPPTRTRALEHTSVSKRSKE